MNRVKDRFFRKDKNHNGGAVVLYCLATFK